VSKTLKQQNHVSLLLFALANACGITVLLAGWDNFAAFVSEISKGNLSLIGRTVGVTAIAGLIAGIASWVVPRKLKETLVFWRVGPRCMPSSRAFSEIAHADPRIDVVRLQARVGGFPVSPAEQSSRWYSIYRKHEKEPAVEDANRAYLLYRDMTSFVPIVGLAVIIVTRFVALPAQQRNWIGVAAILLLEFLFIAVAARNAGTRLVANVLALEASELIKGTPATPATGRRRTRKTDSP
jgi:hypothetical protein